MSRTSIIYVDPAVIERVEGKLGLVLTRSRASAIMLIDRSGLVLASAGDLPMHPDELGAIAAGRDAEKEPALLTFADNIGLVFQIIDDILDVTSTDDVLGKPTGSDVQQGKNTMASLLGVDEARRLAQVHHHEADGQHTNEVSHHNDQGNNLNLHLFFSFFS